MCRPGGQHTNFLTLLDRALDHPDQGHHAQIGVIPAIDQQGAQGGLCIGWRRGGQALHNRFQQIIDAQAAFGRNLQGFTAIQANDIFNLLLYPFRFGGGQVDFVQHRQDFVIIVQRQIDIGQSLRLNPLAGIDNQQ